MDQNNSQQNSQGSAQPIAAVPQADQPTKSAPTVQVDVAALQNLTQAELAKRPADQAAAAPTAEDPLAKLISLVQGSGGQVDPLKVKKLFVSVKNKINHEALESIIISCRDSGVPEKNIVNFLLELDRMVEMEEINEEFFEKSIAQSGGGK